MSEQRYSVLTRYADSKWKCYLFGGNGTGVVWRPVKGEEPNWFWRTMQHLILGHRWVRDE